MLRFVAVPVQHPSLPPVQRSRVEKCSWSYQQHVVGTSRCCQTVQCTWCTWSTDPCLPCYRFRSGGVLCTFSNITAAAAGAGIARSSELNSSHGRAGGTVRHGRRYGPPITVHISASPPLSASQTAQDAVLGQATHLPPLK
jgi:hypothetical protein